MNETNLAIAGLLEDFSEQVSLVRKDVTEKFHMSEVEHKAITVIAHAQGISQKQLGELCSIDKSTTSRLVKKLYKNNIILKSQNEKDKRTVSIKLNENGKTLLNTMHLTVRKTITNRFSRLTGEDKLTLLRLLYKCSF